VSSRSMSIRLLEGFLGITACEGSLWTYGMAETRSKGGEWARTRFTTVVFPLHTQNLVDTLLNWSRNMVALSGTSMHAPDLSVTMELLPVYTCTSVGSSVPCASTRDILAQDVDVQHGLHLAHVGCHLVGHVIAAQHARERQCRGEYDRLVQTKREEPAARAPTCETWVISSKGTLGNSADLVVDNLPHLENTIPHPTTRHLGAAARRARSAARRH